MKLPRRRFWHLSGVVAAVSTFLVVLSGHGAWSQAARTIKIVVPFSAGGSTDILARLLAEQISRTQGPAMVVENRPGASTQIGTEAVARAVPDGNTLLVSANAFIFTPLVRKVNYDPLASFEPICHLAGSPMVFVVNSASPYRTFGDLLNAARSKPGELQMASVGPTTPTQIAVEMLKRTANVNMVYVPYPGEAPELSALLGEHVTSVLLTYPGSAELLKAGKVRALATPSRVRIEPLPDLPTVAESGYNDYEVELWFGLFAPAKTPNTTVSQLAGWFTAAMQVPEIKAKLGVQGLYPVGRCGKDFGAYIRKQNDEYGRVIREANIKAK